MQSEAPCPADVSVAADGLVAEAALPRMEDCHHPQLPLAGAEGRWERGVGCPEKCNISQKAQGPPQDVGPAPVMRPLTDKGQTPPLSASCMVRCIQKPTVLRLGWQTRGGTGPHERKEAPGLGGGAPSPGREVPGRSGLLLSEAPPASGTGLGPWQPPPVLGLGRCVSS